MTTDYVGNCHFSFQNATISRPGGDAILRDFTWSVHEGQTWAIVGPIGSGKTSLAEALLGRLHVSNGEIRWPLIDRLRASGRTVNWPSEVIQCVSFKEESRLFSYGRHYYQQRFNFIEPNDDLTLDAFLRTGASAAEAAMDHWCNSFGIQSLRDLSLIKLSNGQIRRARIVRALLSHPEMLILDEPFMGLDVEGRQELAEMLENLVSQGMRLLLVTRPESIPQAVTHVLELDRSGTSWRGTRSGFVVRHRSVGDVDGRRALPHIRQSAPTGEPIIEMTDVDVVYDRRAILKKVSWTVRKGERWAVLGPNGSGKTTLLSLICGDHPQAYCNNIRLFGRQRGSGESIWDIKRQIGLVSPEIHLYFSAPLTAFQTAATGFFDVLAYRRPTPEQAAMVTALFARFEMTALSERYFSNLSTGEQRQVLLVRALVKQPPLLVLDEPFQGLDSPAISRIREWLDSSLRPDQTLIFVSHYAEEIPGSVNRTLFMQPSEGTASMYAAPYKI